MSRVAVSQSRTTWGHVRRYCAPPLAAIVLSAIAGCALDQPLTKDQRFQLQHPPANVVVYLDHLLPRIVKDTQKAEHSGLRLGRPLTLDESRLAMRVGVIHPELVRIVVTYEFPPTSDPTLAVELKSRFGIGNGTTESDALTMGHAIFIKPGHAEARWLLAHELTHVAQYESLGFNGFVHDYLLQMILVGYAQAPIESAARANEHLGRE